MRSHQTHDLEPSLFARPANLPILSFLQPHFQPSLAVFLAKSSNRDRLRATAVDDDWLLESLESCFAHSALNLDDIDLFDLSLWVQQPHCELSVIRQDEHAAGGVIETPHWN